MKIEIDTEKIDVLVNESGNIIFTPDAENAILQLLELQGSIEEAITAAKGEIEKKALAHNKNFNSVSSNKLRVGYRVFGNKYRIDESRLDSIPKHLYKTEVKFSPISEEIDKYVNEVGSVPLGIEEPERKKQITITLKTSPSEPQGA